MVHHYESSSRITSTTMEARASSFETSEMLASFLTSTPLLSESWRLCNLANTTSPPAGFLVERLLSTSCGVPCLAFSGIRQSAFRLLDPSNADLVKLNSDCTNGMFSGFGDDRNHCGEEDAPVMVHSGLLNLFLNFWNSPAFSNQMQAILTNSKSVIITGHSIGGAIASLTALWLLCYLQSISSHISVLCITFGSPLLGNESLSRAILRKRWGGNFLQVVSKQDIMPRLHLARLPQSLAHHLHLLLQFWHFSMSPSSFFPSFIMQINPEVKNNLLHYAVSHLETRQNQSASSLFWPFGNYVFCSSEGAICLDNSAAIITMLRVLLLMRGSASSIIEDHLKYGDYVDKVSLQFLSKKSFMEENKLSGSSYDAGIALALQSSGIATAQEIDAKPIAECLKLARRMGRTPNLNSANLAISLSKITPYRAEIEWYKASCQDSSDQMGYYDSFKERVGSKRDSKVNMNRLKLAAFWNNVIHMLDNNQLPLDFHKRAKWANASQFYKLLVEPLDIAEYYRKGKHRIKGHYMSNGRDRRYVIFDQWWTERHAGEEENAKRSKFASLTQDSCFWARVEEAKEWLENARIERDAGMLAILWMKINEFEMYARKLVEAKAVSIDVVAINSSYSLWVEEFKKLQQVQQK